ncbi:hypothetical protein O0D92_08290 [Staphylococcus pseudintermedius]|nr:hypothetical protein [Staphylococcus pseudintermedius]
MKNTFTITSKFIIEDEERVCIKIGSLQNGFYKLESEVFELENNFYFDENFKFKKAFCSLEKYFDSQKDRCHN